MGLTDLLTGLPRVGAPGRRRKPAAEQAGFAGNWSCIARTVWSPRRGSCVVF